MIGHVNVRGYAVAVSLQRSQLFEIRHGLDTADLIVQCRSVETNEVEELFVDTLDNNTIAISAVSGGDYRIQILALTQSPIRGFVADCDLVAGTPFEVEHGLGSLDLIMQVVNQSTGEKDDVFSDVIDNSRVVLQANVSGMYRLQVVAL